MLRSASLLFCALLSVTACGDDATNESTQGAGGSGGTSSGTGNSNSGASTGSGGQGVCPDAMPNDGEACTPDGLECSYGDCCPSAASCVDGKWETYITDCAEQPCPEVPPAAGDSCACFSSPTCAYDQCATSGNNVTATCDGTVWQVATEPCMAVTCGNEGLECNAGDLCVSHAGGPGISYACTPNPCPDQPLSCDCAGPALCGTDQCVVVSPQEVSCSCPDCP